jgi:hypothetical protein
VVSLHGQRLLTVLDELFFDGVSNGAYLTVGGTTANKKVIGHRGPRLHIQHDDIFGLFTVGSYRTEMRLFQQC